jgi:HlyD family secretion protein
MDVTRPPKVAHTQRRRRIMLGGVTLAVITVATVALGRLKPAAPTVEAGTLWIDSVKRGKMVRQVRGIGVLVPGDIRWVTALTEGRVERVLVEPGTTVAPQTILLELSNPQTEQAAMTADLDYTAARAQFDVAKADLERDLLAQRSAAATVASEAAQTKMDAEAADTLADKGLISPILARQTRLRAETSASRWTMEQARLVNSETSLAARLEVQQTEVQRRRTMVTLRRNEALGLKIRAGVAGVLQQVPVEVGQRIGPGTNLARVADPARLRAQLQIAETQVKDIAIGQHADIDTRNGVVRGHVARIDPAAKNGTVTVDVVLDEALPRGARPDMGVDGTIELERLDNILYVGRPAFGKEQGKVSLFKLSPDKTSAALTPVELGRSSVNAVEVIRGLNAGDCVVLSDMSAWVGHDRVRLSGNPPCAEGQATP